MVIFIKNEKSIRKFNLQKNGLKQSNNEKIIHPPPQFSLEVQVYKCLTISSFSLRLYDEKQVPFSMAIGKEELMHECFPKHLHMGTARMK